MTPRASATLEIRRPVESDRAAMNAFIAHDVAGTPYAAVPEYFLRLALAGRIAESRAVIAEYDGEVVGFALYGDVSGSVRTGRVHFITVSASSRLNGVGIRLCEAVVADLVSGGARLVVAELPDDPLLVGGRVLFSRCGFEEVGRVDDYYRDGVALIVLARQAAIG